MHLTMSCIRLAAPVIPEHAPAGLRLLASILSNPVEIWGREHFEQPIVIKSTFLGLRILVNDPDAIKRVLVDNAGNYVRDNLQRRILLRATGHSLFSVEGDRWQWQRRMFDSMFTPDRLASYVNGMADAASAAARMVVTAESPIDVSAEMARTTVDVLMRTILPGASGEDPADIAASVRNIVDSTGAVSLADLLNLPVWVPTFRSLRALRAERSAAERACRIVAGQRNLADHNDCTRADDLVSLMLMAREPKTHKSMSEREIKNNVSTFLGAGSDTVASALTWSLYLLSRSPEFCDLLEREVDEVVIGRPMSLNLIDRLPFTRAVIEEAMRLYPPVPLLSRAAMRDDVLCGRKIPAGSVVIIAPWVLHRHQLLWDDPLEFDPRRFLPPRRDRIRHFAYLPFGAGPRICVGRKFAMQEAVIVLATLLSSLRFALAPGMSVRVCQVFTLRPKEGLAMVVERRLREKTRQSPRE
jgi:cytochrome P450